MSKTEYDNYFKLEVLERCEVVGNVSAVAEQYDLSRATIYSWKKKEDEIRESVAKDKVTEKITAQIDVRSDVLDKITTYEGLLQEIGGAEERRKALANQVEHLLMTVVSTLENHPDLAETRPKDLSKIMVELRETKDKLSREPDVVIEYRDAMMETVLSVLRGSYLTDDQLRDFVRKVEAVEADFEVIKED